MTTLDSTISDGERLDRRTAHRWVRSIGKRAGLGAVHPHMLRAARTSTVTPQPSVGGISVVQ